MNAPEQFKQQLDKALEEMKRAKKKQADSDEPADPKIEALLARAMEIVNELDPIVRETMRDNPEALAEWEDIMRERDDPSDEKKS